MYYVCTDVTAGDSHALVLKSGGLLNASRIPTIADKTESFPGFPLGTACLSPASRRFI